jgi:hypothetical protein
MPSDKLAHLNCDKHFFSIFVLFETCKTYEMCSGCKSSGQGQVAGTCGYDEGLSGSINAGNFLTSCKVYWLASQEEGLCSME